MKHCAASTRSPSAAASWMVASTPFCSDSTIDSSRMWVFTASIMAGEKSLSFVHMIIKSNGAAPSSVSTNAAAVGGRIVTSPSLFVNSKP